MRSQSWWRPWARRAAWIQRFTAMRIGETMALTWDRVDLEHAQLLIRAEDSKGGYSGRVLPMAPALHAEMSTWSREAEWVCGESSARVSATSRPARTYVRSWKRAGVRELAWRGQPTHALRKGVISGLHALGAQPDAVELLAGHSLGGTRRPYLDPQIAFNLAELVATIPPIGGLGPAEDAETKESA